MATVKDVVCGMEIDPERTALASLQEHGADQADRKQHMNHEENRRHRRT